MSIKSLGNPFSEKTDLRHGAECGCDGCAHDAQRMVAAQSGAMSSDQMLERAIESAVVRSVFGQNDIQRRSFMGMMGGGAIASIIA